MQLFPRTPHSPNCQAIRIRPSGMDLYRWNSQVNRMDTTQIEEFAVAAILTLGKAQRTFEFACIGQKSFPLTRHSVSRC